MSLENYKKEFFVSPLTHLNNAGLAPISLSASEEIKYWAERFYKEGFYTDLDYSRRVDQSRLNLANLIGCSNEEIAFFQSTAGAISQFAFMLNLQPNDEVLTWDQEYSSNLYPWQEACKRAGAKLILVKSGENLETPIERMLNQVNAKTRVVAVSWVQFQTGARSDLKALVEHCKKNNILVIADIMQGLGLHEFNFQSVGVDAVAGGSHKWLTSPVGVGFLAIRKELAQKMKPLVVGAYTYGTCEDPADLTCEPKNSALRFEAGSKQVLEITALGRSVELILKTGVKNIETEALRLSTELRKILLELGFTIHSPQQKEATPIVNFSHSKHSLEKIIATLQSHQINFARRGPGLRFSPHAFNSEQDLERVQAALKNLKDA